MKRLTAALTSASVSPSILAIVPGGYPCRIRSRARRASWVAWAPTISAPASAGSARKNQAAAADRIAIATNVPRKAVRPDVPSPASHVVAFSAPVARTTLSDEEACRKMLARVDASALSSGEISATWLGGWAAFDRAALRNQSLPSPPAEPPARCFRPSPPCHPEGSTSRDEADLFPPRAEICRLS